MWIRPRYIDRWRHGREQNLNIPLSLVFIFLNVVLHGPGELISISRLNEAIIVVIVICVDTQTLTRQG